LRRFLAVCVSTIVLAAASGPTAIAQETEADSTTEESGEEIPKKAKHQTLPAVGSGPTAIAQEREANPATQESAEEIPKKAKHQTLPESARTKAQPPAKADPRGHKKVKDQPTPKSHQERKTGQAKK
jgi:hypothetical protein